MFKYLGLSLATVVCVLSGALPARASVALEAVSSSPYGQEVNVSVSATPYVIFSNILNTSTVIAKNIQLRRYDDSLIITTTLSLAEGDTKVIFTFAEYLINSTTYYFFIGAGIKDVSGNKLANTWYAADKKKHSFTTASSSTYELPVVNDSGEASSSLVNNILEENLEEKNKTAQNNVAVSGGGGAPVSLIPYFININTEVLDLKSKSALLKMEVNNNPAQMMISLSPQLSDTVWVPYSENILWNFGNEVSGTTTIYARLKNSYGEGMMFNYIFSLRK